ncbi:MAG: bifunctional adenosylcobinamide kinase/adenosylcobinamide-phosphate guanylyltransferase [Paracoccaceae bacterium]
MTVKPMKTLIIGGAASGKSAYAEGLASNSKLYKIYLASANIYDEEMQLKVNKHKIRRGDDWTTISEPLRGKRKDHLFKGRSNNVV